jgi:serine/threonine-protein kinase HipA
LLYGDDGWRLSPAFDIVPQTEIVEPVQAIAVGTFGGIPTIDNCLSRCGEFALSRDAAKAIVDKMVEHMRNWQDDFRSLGVPEATIGGLRRAFALVPSGDGAGTGSAIVTRPR